MTFQAWVDELITRRFGTATALAERLGMRLSPFTRGVAAGTLNLVNLLKLARIAEEHPSKVLRLARKEEEAALLEELYGSGRDALTPTLRGIIDDLEHVPDDVREHFAVLLHYARNVASHTVPVKSGSPPEARPRRRRAARRRSSVHTE